MAQIAGRSTPLPLGAACTESDAYEYYASREGTFSVTGVVASTVEPPAELAYMWRGRDALCIMGKGADDTDALDESLQRILERGVSGVVRQSDIEGYTYTTPEADILRISSRGCGHLYGDADTLRWVVALSPSMQVWDRTTGRRARRQETLQSMAHRLVPVRLIVALRGIAVPYEDGPYFDFEVVAVETICEPEVPPPVESPTDDAPADDAPADDAPADAPADDAPADAPADADAPPADAADPPAASDPPPPPVASAGDSGEGEGTGALAGDATEGTPGGDGGDGAQSAALMQELLQTQRELAERIAALAREK